MLCVVVGRAAVGDAHPRVMPGLKSKIDKREKEEKEKEKAVQIDLALDPEVLSRLSLLLHRMAATYAKGCFDSPTSTASPSHQR